MKEMFGTRRRKSGIFYRKSKKNEGEKEHGKDSIAEFLYIQFTETNPVESKEVKESYIAFMDELVKLIGFEEVS